MHIKVKAGRIEKAGMWGKCCYFGLEESEGKDQEKSEKGVVLGNRCTLYIHLKSKYIFFKLINIHFVQ